MNTSIKEFMGNSVIILKMSVILAGYFSFDNLYMMILDISPINNLHEFLVNAKDIISLLFSITVLIIGIFKMIKHIKEYKKDKTEEND